MAPKSNRIEVDLNLMQKEAISRLDQFGKDFNNTVDRLASLLQNVSADVGGSGAGQLGPNASTAAKTDAAVAAGGGAGRSGPPGTLNAGASTPGGDHQFEDQFVRLQRRIGANEMAIPQSLRQALGYAAEGQLNFNPMAPIKQYGTNRDQNIADALAQLRSTSAYQAMSPADRATAEAQATNSARWRTRFGTANDMMFNYEASKALAMKGLGKYTAFTAGVQHITDYGYQTAPNTGTGGILGSSLFSGSFWHGLNESTWQPLVSSTFGLNPAYSLGQAQQARQAINQYGWSSGNMGNWLANVLKENTIRYRLDPQTQMQFLDPMLRWGGWQSFGQLNAVLASLATSAQAAGMNVSQFNQELSQTAMQVAQQTGNTPGTVAGILSNFSATTGLAPSQGADLLSMNNVLMSAAYTGKNPWDIYTGKDQGATLAVPLTRFSQMLGMGVDSFMRMAHGTKAQQEFFKNRMWQMTMLYQTNPQIFGGMSPLQLMNIMQRNGGVKGAERHMQIRGQIENLTAAANSQGVPLHSIATNHRIEDLIKQYDPTHASSMIHDYLKMVGAGSTMQQRKQAAEQAINAQAHNKQLQAARHITIELSGDAKKYFQLANDPGHTNSGQSFGRKALGFFEGVGQSALSDVTGGLFG